MIYPGLVGLWETTMETLSLMTIAVLISLAIGIPLGVWAARSPRVERAIRPVLDAMQTIPAPVYFIPIVLFFGIRRVPATIATIIYALPPAVRLTTLGIQGVPRQSVEAAEMFGSTRRQTLFKVQLPMAMPSIMTGINQTIMMALGIVVIASLLGAGGLGPGGARRSHPTIDRAGAGGGAGHRGDCPRSGSGESLVRLRRPDPTRIPSLHHHLAGRSGRRHRGWPGLRFGRIPRGLGRQSL